MVVRTLARCGLAAVGALAGPALARAAGPEAPCPPAAPQVIVEVPPPKVVFRQAPAPAAVGPVKPCCHFGCHHPLATVMGAPAPLAYAPPPAAAYSVASPYAYAHAFPVAPAAPLMYHYAPVAAAPQVVAAPYQVLHLAAPAAPAAVVGYAPPAVAAAPPSATAPRAAAPTDCDAALKRITAQMESLTRVVEAHTSILTSHEERLQKLEKWVADSAERKAPAPFAPLTDRQPFPLGAPAPVEKK